MQEVKTLPPEIQQLIDEQFQALKRDIHEKFIVLRQKILGDGGAMNLWAG
ncbi:hypothetical protein [Limnohabitans sp.]|nr:hypothetical protein [Limnohabitans sp.]